MTKYIKGSFDIKATPAPPNPMSADLGATRVVFHKTFHGDLAGTSIVEMLGILNKDIGSGAYVAMERLNVTLDGRSGSFYLYHSSSMQRGKQAQSIQVVPDSGAGDLAGIAGSMTIDIVDGKHFYNFSYDL
jgi:hypothetical protein